MKTKKEQFIEEAATLLVYMCDEKIPDQWGTCEKYAEIIWDKYVKELLKSIVPKEKENSIELHAPKELWEGISAYGYNEARQEILTRIKKIIEC